MVIRIENHICARCGILSNKMRFAYWGSSAGGRYDQLGHYPTPMYVCHDGTPCAKRQAERDAEWAKALAINKE